jgi:starvation-inducible outer membrane lipoprotein
MLNFKKIMTAAAVSTAAVTFLTGCGSAPHDLTPKSVLSDDWDITYLKVNDKSVVCYNESDSYSPACEWNGVEIPNGFEIIELTNEIPDSDGWKLSSIVTVSNETVLCLSQQSRFGSCDFKLNPAEDGYGESR